MWDGHPARLCIQFRQLAHPNLLPSVFLRQDLRNCLETGLFPKIIGNKRSIKLETGFLLTCRVRQTVVSSERIKVMLLTHPTNCTKELYAGEEYYKCPHSFPFY
ncbi:hypothetical protein OSCI_4120020 [Kamptonema sp. PCC 6506]|nr:hypothetical protein OSCI_4120020 [Kamptonema sp. PCC 6506]